MKPFYKEDSNCLFELNAGNKCWFNLWSIQHFYYPAFFYSLFLTFLIKQNFSNQTTLLLALLGFAFIHIFHFIDEYLGNLTTYSPEGLLRNIFYKDDNKPTDNDSIQNSFGDIISGFIGLLLILSFFLIKNETLIIPLSIMFIPVTILAYLFQK